MRAFAASRGMPSSSDGNCSSTTVSGRSACSRSVHSRVSSPTSISRFLSDASTHLLYCSISPYAARELLEHGGVGQSRVQSIGALARVVSDVDQPVLVGREHPLLVLLDLAIR